jgi:hypothetical protein
MISASCFSMQIVSEFAKLALKTLDKYGKLCYTTDNKATE